MKQLYFHGTTRKGAENILSGKDKSEFDTAWTVSDNDGLIYLWDREKLGNGDYEDDKELWTDATLNQAFESAQITACVNKIPQNELIVLEFEIDPDEVMEDYSCENMDYAVCCSPTILKNAHISTYSCPHNSRLDAIRISNCLEMEYFNQEEIDEDLLEAANVVKGCGIYLEPEFDYKCEYDKKNEPKY